MAITGLDEAQERLEGIADRLRNMTPVMEVAAQDTKTLIDDSFRETRSPDGTPWRELSDATEAINPRRVDGKPLTDTGRLRNSVTTESGKSGFSFGTNTQYAATHQFGNPNSKLFGKTPAPIPARPFLPITGSKGRLALMQTGPAKQHWDSIRAMIQHWILTGEYI